MGNDSHLLNMSLPVKSPKRTSLDCNHSDKLNGKSDCCPRASENIKENIISCKEHLDIHSISH